ncbi:hypothetical protein SUGI_0887330 [Cryptomeria japonica]|nr:hypothetical protein SUGI_0887330 [Cryptomeria japonica]
MSIKNGNACIKDYKQLDKLLDLISGGGGPRLWAWLDESPSQMVAVSSDNSDQLFSSPAVLNSFNNFWQRSTPPFRGDFLL